MDAFTKQLVQHSQELARKWLKERLEAKFIGSGIQVSQAMLDALSKHIVECRDGEFQWDDGDLNQNSYEITFDEVDHADLEKYLATLAKVTPAVVRNVTRKTGRDLFRAYKRAWPAEDAWHSSEGLGFEERLEERWGQGLSLLRMLHVRSLEMGREAHRRLRRSKAKRPSIRRQVLLQLHGRGVQITGEIITLLAAGYADGAMARWRTLHEVTVVAILIADAGNDLAQRYADHEYIEAKSASDLLVRAGQREVQTPAFARERMAVLRNYDLVIAKYGKDFGSPNGWTKLADNPRPKFDHLEDAAGRAMLRSEYKLASYNVHAGIKGISFRLGLRGDPGILAGCSNAGLAEPAHFTAQAMAQLNFLIYPLGKRTFNQVVDMQFLLMLQRAISRAFSKVEKEMDQYEEARKNQK